MPYIVCAICVTFSLCAVWMSNTLHRAQQQGNGQLDKYEWED